jgi:hypothetical protein
MGPSRILLMLLRVGAGVQLVLGIGLWTATWPTLVGVHMAVGIAFVLLLWTMAIIALAKRRSPGLAAAALAWGIVIAVVGMTQQGILPGPLHWIVRVVHLVIGLAAMPLAERLAPPSRRAVPAGTVPA